MVMDKTHAVHLYVSRTTRQWIVRDRDGNLWRLPSTANPWSDREPCESAVEEQDLEPVPGHYKYMLGLQH